MGKSNQETVTTFTEIFSSIGIIYHQQSRQITTDYRPMIYFHGMKLYIPDDFQPETLQKSLQVMKQL